MTVTAQSEALGPGTAELSLGVYREAGNSGCGAPSVPGFQPLLCFYFAEEQIKNR